MSNNGLEGSLYTKSFWKIIFMKPQALNFIIHVLTFFFKLVYVAEWLILLLWGSLVN